MKKTFLFVITLLFSITLFAQSEYDNYLQNAYAKLKEGNIANAEQIYTVYRKLTGKTDVNFEALLRQKKKRQYSISKPSQYQDYYSQRRVVRHGVGRRRHVPDGRQQI